MTKRLLFILALSGLTLLNSSCKKDKDNGDGSSGTGDLTISLSRSTVELNGFDYVAITVKDGAGNDVTAGSTIYLNQNQAISSNYVPISIGTFDISARKGNVNSNTKPLNVIARGPSPFSTKVVVEDVTGTWCQYCPRVAYKLEQYKLTNPNLISVGIHGGSSDPYKFQYYPTFNSAYGISGYPSAVLNRKSIWNESNAELNSAFQQWAPLGLSISSSLSGGTITGNVKVKFNVTTLRPMKVIIALVENGLVYPQVNSTSYYGGGNPISNFVHDGVLRRTSTDLFGDVIPADQMIKDKEYTIPFSMSLSGSVYGGGSYSAVGSNCGIVAMVTDGTSNTAGVFNAQYAAAGQTKNYD